MQEDLPDNLQDNLHDELHHGYEGRDDPRDSGRIDPEKLALWSIPAGAAIVALAFLAGGWAAAPGRSVQGPRPIVAPAPVASVPQQPAYAVAPPPPPIMNRRPPDSNVLITPVPAVSRATRSAAPPAPPAASNRTPAAPPAVASTESMSPSGGFTLPPSRAASGDPAPYIAPDEETLRLARARAEMIREEQARIERDRAQRIAALDAARRTAANEARNRQRSRMDPGLTSPSSGRTGESHRRHEAFFSDSDFRDEQSTWSRR